MEILKPSTKLYHCNCDCGAEFLAFEKDITLKDILCYDKFGSAFKYDNFHNSLNNIKCEVIECPFCGGFVILKDNGFGIREQDISSKEISKNFNKVRYNEENSESFSEFLNRKYILEKKCRL